MEQASAPISANLDAYEAVFTVLSKYVTGSVISTGGAICTIRARFPHVTTDDEELVGMIVHAIGGRTIAVSFDHRQAA